MLEERKRHVIFLCLGGLFLLHPTSFGFQVASSHHRRNNLSLEKAFESSSRLSPAFRRQTCTRLRLLLDVPDNFFAITFPMLGIILSISKSFVRLRMEERAWEQRLDEAREKRLLEDSTLTEIELRRREAALEWSAYGKPNIQVAERESKRLSRRVKVLERDEQHQDHKPRKNKPSMSDEEIASFEMEYGVEYDPYYDDPYTEEELNEVLDQKFSVDRKYGDRIYENGEIFYKDKLSGLFYRQGAKPRSLSFF